MHSLLKLLEVKLYSDSWNNISLTDIAEKLRLHESEVAAGHFYEEFYRRLQGSDFAVDPEWLHLKIKTTAWIQQLCDLSGVRPGTGKAVSLGAGLGIAELPLIERGYHLELQECQPYSLGYIRNKGAVFTEWITTDLSILPEDSYNAVYVGSLSYVFDTGQYLQFFKQCHRMLTAGGNLMLWDPECFLPPAHWLMHARNLLLLKRRGVLWGWLRSSVVHRSLARQAGFELVDQACFDKQYDPVSPPFRLLGFTAPYSRSHIQRYIFRKP